MVGCGGVVALVVGIWSREDPAREEREGGVDGGCLYGGVFGVEGFAGAGGGTVGGALYIAGG